MQDCLEVKSIVISYWIHHDKVFYPYCQWWREIFRYFTSVKEAISHCKSPALEMFLCSCEYNYTLYYYYWHIFVYCKLLFLMLHFVKLDLEDHNLTIFATSCSGVDVKTAWNESTHVHVPQISIWVLACIFLLLSSTAYCPNPTPEQVVEHKCSCITSFDTLRTCSHVHCLPFPLLDKYSA